MKALALDIGEKRTGVAAGDTDAKIAIPISVIATKDVLTYASSFRRLVEDHEPELLVVGLPLTLGGEENQQTLWVREHAEHIAKTLGIPLVYQDERLTSTEAKRYLRQAGCTEREMRGKIDMVAASLLLRAYLDAGLS
ncbi:MAG: Holliday junction resolvase RuvX [Coriobacteriales bacterium]|jgi:putative Holliday junction resolvase|nr:Holliday junction resolvase RuvX [Coriobacteriales bacterium]